MTRLVDIALTVNGKPVTGKVEPRRTLADFLRDDLDMTGTHVGCEHGVCGACTILVNGASMRSCLMFAVQVDGAELNTVEGLAVDGKLTPLQDAFHRHHALQCGFCTPGLLMTAEAFLKENPSPTADEVRDAISGNICRCTGYIPIVEAILDAAEQLKKTDAA
ncbi:(2Fe-2S)-binding protein [Peristeroidobacter soli]|uniref:(2Fe-2S)-binding protein n=1 Tax=Peristeroidobacter soli TaxID=2497877 RepID=UPI00101DE7DB|nr:(2Fe-2S)-binding protein [Peristeroidobacter soli]